MAIVIEGPFLGSAFLHSNCIRGLATSRPSFGEQFNVCTLIINITLHRARDEKSRQILAFSRRCDPVPCTIPALHRIDCGAKKNREPEQLNSCATRRRLKQELLTHDACPHGRWRRNLQGLDGFVAC
ncbi:hypothetical protein [Bradyrhizobium shewense]|uniref:hypothetical protein n=1 Tax=Bradyrhizobium shewense TaxID=1761772 RepID=UPI00101AE653|nr:hypothetical protein [Bradyrhizobium shewense]